jgi:hypothetical protein
MAVLLAVFVSPAHAIPVEFQLVEIHDLSIPPNQITTQLQIRPADGYQWVPGEYVEIETHFDLTEANHYMGVQLVPLQSYGDAFLDVMPPYPSDPELWDARFKGSYIGVPGSYPDDGDGDDGFFGSGNTGSIWPMKMDVKFTFETTTTSEEKKKDDTPEWYKRWIAEHNNSMRITRRSSQSDERIIPIGNSGVRGSWSYCEIGINTYTGQLVIIPEPAGVGLVCAGGYFLARYKKRSIAKD